MITYRKRTLVKRKEKVEFQNNSILNDKKNKDKVSQHRKLATQVMRPSQPHMKQIKKINDV